MKTNRREIVTFGVCLIFATAAKCIGLGENNASGMSKNISTEQSVEGVYPIWSQAKDDIFNPYPSLMDTPTPLDYSHNGAFQP